jgi:Tfp pilus assembly protein PilV
MPPITLQPVRTRPEERGLTILESVIVLSLLMIVLLGVTGLHVLAISTGKAAEASTIATNLARARLEELIALPPSQIIQQNNTEAAEQVPAGQGRTYTVRTGVDSPDPTRLDITITVTWGQAFSASCGPGEQGAACAGSTATYTRTLQTRIYAPDNL